MRGIPESLALLRPDDLFAVWCLVDSLEQAGDMTAEDAVRWKQGIYGLMELWGLEPDDLVDPFGLTTRRGVCRGCQQSRRTHPKPTGQSRDAR